MALAQRQMMFHTSKLRPQDSAVASRALTRSGLRRRAGLIPGVLVGRLSMSLAEAATIAARSRPPQPTRDRGSGRAAAVS